MLEAVQPENLASGQISRFSSIEGIRERACARSLKPPPKIALADWIESNITLPADVSATPGAMRLFSYQRGICDAVDDPAISRV